MSVLRSCLPALWLLMLAVPARAQVALSDEARISLITILPGEAVYAVFGHSALRLYDPVLGLDVSYNYGTFDFGDPLVFVGRFSYGKLDYFLSVQSFPQAADHYWHVEGRPLIEQVLNLSAAQREALFRFLEINARPENKFYRYDFFFDNCSTRIRDVLEQVLGEAVQFAPAPDPGLSFRGLIDPYLAGKPFVHLGVDLGLGAPADRLATPRETTFLPLYLMASFDHATVRIDGQTGPLVARTDTVAGVAARAAPEPAPPWPAIFGWALLALGLVLTLRDVRARQVGHRLFDGLLFGVAGVAGLLVAFLWFVSLHQPTRGNLNLFWAWPTHLVAALALAGRARGRWLRIYLAAAALATLVLLLGWPLWPQALPPAVLPLLLLLAVRGAALAYLPRATRRTLRR